MLLKLCLLLIILILQAPVIHSFLTQRRIANWKSEILSSLPKNSYESSFSQDSLYPTLTSKGFFLNPFSRSSIKDSLPTDYYVGLLNTLPVYGKWYSTSSSKQFDMYNEKAGIVSTERLDEETDPYKLSFALDVPDGGYLASNDVIIIFNQVPIFRFLFDKNNATLTAKNLLAMTYFYVSNNDKPVIKPLYYDLSIYFVDLINNKPLQPNTTRDNVGIQFNVKSTEAKLSIVTNIMTKTRIATEELMLYIAIMSLAALVGIYSAERLIKNFPENMNQLEKLSVWSLCLTNAWDFFLFVFHAAFFIALSASLAVVTICYFALSALSETKLTYAIFFSSYSGSAVSLVIQRRFLATYYFLMMAFNLSYIYWSYNTLMIWTLMSSSLFLVPQIIHVHQRGRNYRFNYWQVFGFMLSRVSFIGYMTLYEDNLFGNTINPTFFYIYITIIFAQLLVLFVQKWYPRFCYTPAVYNYYVEINTEKEKDELCAICMESLGTTVTESESLTKPLLGKSDSVTVMQTPCNHRFHETCLKAWTSSKLLCPFDRTDLPPLNNEDIE